MVLRMSIPLGFAASGSSPFMAILRSLSLTSGLQFSLDAGDSASYASGQSWLDTSGNGQNFFLGTSASVEATSDPTFNGHAGNLSINEYWSPPVGTSSSQFTYANTEEAWMQTLHKSGATFTFMTWIYIPSSLPDNSSYSFVKTSTNANAGSNGIYWGIIRISGVSSFIFTANKGSGQPLDAGSSGEGIILTPDNNWHFFGISQSESAGPLIWMLDGVTANDSSNGSYNNPSTSSSSQTMKLVDGLFSQSTGPRLAGIAAWNTALSAAQMNNFYNASKSRFGK